MTNKVCCCLRFSFAVVCGVRYFCSALRLAICLPSIRIYILTLFTRRESHRESESVFFVPFSERQCGWSAVAWRHAPGYLWKCPPSTTAPNTRRSESGRAMPFRRRGCKFEFRGTLLIRCHQIKELLSTSIFLELVPVCEFVQALWLVIRSWCSSKLQFSMS